MNRPLQSLLMASLLAACSQAPLAPSATESKPHAAPAAAPARGYASAPDPELARAQAAMQDLGQRLRGALRERMQSEGPIGAVGFCHDEAPGIADAVSRQHGLALGRTALRVRSPANAPSDWQRSVLEDFQARFEAGTPVAELVYVQRDGLPAGVALRVMRGIPVEAPCELCHGRAIAEPVAQAIAANYPGDQATGFASGDLRGAFWAEVPATEDATP